MTTLAFILLRYPADTLDLTVYDNRRCRKNDELGDFLKNFYRDNRDFFSFAATTASMIFRVFSQETHPGPHTLISIFFSRFKIRQ